MLSDSVHNAETRERIRLRTLEALRDPKVKSSKSQFCFFGVLSVHSMACLIVVAMILIVIAYFGSVSFLSLL